MNLVSCMNKNVLACSFNRLVLILRKKDLYEHAWWFYGPFGILKYLLGSCFLQVYQGLFAT